jgi:outer membrane protein assembly factor BamB
VPPPASSDWPTDHRDQARTGNDPSFPAPGGSLVRRWSTPLDGAVYAEPLVVGGRVIAATEGDSVYALDPATGGILWRRNLGAPVPLASLPCGNIDPLGITGTPAYDPLTGSLFVVAEVTGPKHAMFALDVTNGTVRWSRDIDLAGDDPRAHQQRAALAIGSGYVYVGMGGLFGDCGQYQGEVVGVPTSGDGSTLAYRVPVEREGAVWASAGPVVDPNGDLYVSVGNGSSTTTYDGSDSVLQLSPTLQLRSTFAPSTWAQDNAADADLGSLSPVLVPGGWVFIVGKSGTGYVLRQGALGGVGGEVASGPVCPAFGGAAQAGATIYVPCSNELAAVRITPDGPIGVVWRAGVGADGPPVVGDGAVWSLDIESGELWSLDPATGAGLAHTNVGPLPHFASPTLWGDQVLVGTVAGVESVGVR